MVGAEAEREERAQRPAITPAGGEMPGVSWMPAFAIPSVKSSTARVAVAPVSGLLRSRSQPWSRPPERLVVPPTLSCAIASSAFLRPAPSIFVSGSRVSTVLSKATRPSVSPDCRPFSTRNLSVVFILFIFSPAIEPERSATTTTSSGWRAESGASGAMMRQARRRAASLWVTAPRRSS